MVSLEGRGSRSGGSRAMIRAARGCSAVRSPGMSGIDVVIRSRNESTRRSPRAYDHTNVRDRANWRKLVSVIMLVSVLRLATNTIRHCEYLSPVTRRTRRWASGKSATASRQYLVDTVCTIVGPCPTRQRYFYLALFCPCSRALRFRLEFARL